MNLRKKVTWIFCANFLTFIMTFMTYAADTKEPLIFAGDMNYPPFESIKDGQPIGMNVDILRALSKVMHRDIEIRLMKWSEAQQMLIDDKADALTEMAYSESRAEFFDFSEQTLLYKYSFFVKKDDELINHLSDAEGKTIAVTKGGYPRQLLKSNKKINFYIMGNYLDGFKRLLAGNVDAVAADYWVGAYTLQENHLTHAIKFDTRSFAEKSGFIPVKKGNTELLKEINKGITKLRKDGTIQEIYDRWSGKSLVFLTKEKLKKLITTGSLFLSFLIIIFTVFWIFTLKKQLKARTAGLQKAHDNLESEVQERTNSLQREIAAHRIAEKKLRESEDKFRSISEQSLVGIYLIQDSVFKYVNPKFCEIVGYTVKECLGDMPFTVLVHPDDLETVEEQVQKRLSGETKFVQYETRCIKKNRDVIDIVVLGSSAVYNAEPVVIGTVLDITERKRAEKALQESEEKYHDLYDNAPDMFASVCVKTKTILECNETLANTLGYSKEEIIGGLIFDIYTPDSAEYSKEKGFPVFVKTGTIMGEELQLQRKDGSSLNVSLNVSAVRDESGNLLSSRSVWRDITERKKIESQLLQAQKMESVGQLAGGVAHEINNPINGIMNYAQLIQDKIGEENQLSEYTSEIIHETERVSKIVKNLLVFARQENETHSPARMKDIVDDTMTLIQTVLKQDQIILIADISEDLPKIKCRSQQIQQVVMNLITNARDSLNEKYPEFDDNKKIEIISVFIEKGGRRWIRTTVEDRGLGIAQDISERMFDPFYTTKERHRGTGLGLSISYGIVKDHHGELSIESEPGQYTRFHVDLPVDNGWDLSSSL